MTYVYAKTLLIGDAAHPGSTFASGGTQAIEDAGAIFGLFSENSVGSITATLA